MRNLLSAALAALLGVCLYATDAMFDQAARGRAELERRLDQLEVRQSTAPAAVCDAAAQVWKLEIASPLGVGRGLAFPYKRVGSRLFFLTAGHCVPGALDLTARHQTWGMELFNGRVECYGLEDLNDYAVVSFETGYEPPLFELAPWTPLSGDRIYCTPYDQRNGVAYLSEGLASGPGRATFSVIRGTSGGPVLDWSGRVVGIVESYSTFRGLSNYTPVENFLYAIP